MRPTSLPRVARTVAPGLAPTLALASLLALGNAGCLLQHHANTNPLAGVKSNQPDKTLFDIAMADLDKNKFTVARLNLETLLNTYPDSEYLARAKMAIADSWFREGGVEGMAQAEAQYKDFITFFPAMKEASEAQLKVAQIHYRQLQKPDRDPTEATRAQAELRTFLVNYPDSPLRPQALQMLRSTQEVLAEREFRIGEFYLQRAQAGDYSDYRAAQSRLEETLNRYPLYSRGDVALDALANSYLTTSTLYAGAAKLETNPQTKSLYAANASADRAKAVADFDRLINRYPLSPTAKDASLQLTRLHLAVPKASEADMVFNRQEITGRTQVQRSKGFAGFMNLSSIWTGRPEEELARADKVGAPMLAEPQAPELEPLPGLNALLRETMIASGAVKANQPADAKLSAVLTGTGGAPAGATPPPTATASSPAATPLAFQNVPDKPRGADTPESSTPQAMTGSNADDPNARPAAVAPLGNVLLTPNEIDIENREQMLAAEIHRDVPATLPELEKAAKKQSEAQAKLLAAFRKQQAEAKKPSPTQATPTSSPDASGGGQAPTTPSLPAVPAKSSKPWYHIWS